MSGICAIWSTEYAGDSTLRILKQMTPALCLCEGERISWERDLAFGAGVAARFPAQQQVFQNHQVIVACDTDLSNCDELSVLVPDPKTAKPAELIAHLYAKFGPEFIDKLRGAFSFVLCDRVSHNVLAAVDNIGIKRLCYYEDSKKLVIASRIEALLHAGGVGSDVNPRAIANVLNFTASLGPETIYKRVNRIPPGAKLLSGRSGSCIKKYWEMSYFPGGRVDEEQLSQEMSAEIYSAVAHLCKGYSPAILGAFLSGGTDSSTVVGSMARANIAPANAFSIGFEEQNFDELDYARLAARHFGAKHYTYLVSAADCVDAIPTMIRSFDEPFGNSSAIPTYFCAKLAADQGVNMLLAGDGGDELFGGNERYATDRIFGLYQDIPRLLRKGVIEPALALLPDRPRLTAMAKSYVRRSNLAAVDRIYSYHFLNAHNQGEIFDEDFHEELNNYSILEIPSKYYAEASAAEHLDRVLYADMKITLGDSDLPKVTTMSEAAGIQVRFPFLDRRVVEFSGRMPAHLKLKGREKRYLFKRAFRDLLPVEIIKKKKHGFGIPVSVWLKTDRRMRELAHDTLLSSRCYERGYFRRDFISEMMKRHESDNTSYYGDNIWTLLMLELWHRQFVDQPVIASV